MDKQNGAGLPIIMFYSYAHEDEGLCKELEKHLALLKWQGVVANWHDRDISAGTEWSREINIHLNSAQIILLLVSADFLASKYCYSIEMDRALERHDAGEARVIPVILRPVEWETAPFARLQCLPPDGKPVTMWTNQDEAFRTITTEIRKVIQSRVGTVRLDLSLDQVSLNPPPNRTYTFQCIRLSSHS